MPPPNCSHIRCRFPKGGVALYDNTLYKLTRRTVIVTKTPDEMILSSPKRVSVHYIMTLTSKLLAGVFIVLEIRSLARRLQVTVLSASQSTNNSARVRHSSGFISFYQQRIGWLVIWKDIYIYIYIYTSLDVVALLTRKSTWFAWFPVHLKSQFIELVGSHCNQLKWLLGVLFLIITIRWHDQFRKPIWSPVLQSTLESTLARYSFGSIDIYFSWLGQFHRLSFFLTIWLCDPLFGRFIWYICCYVFVSVFFSPGRIYHLLHAFDSNWTGVRGSGPGLSVLTPKESVVYSVRTMRFSCCRLGITCVINCWLSTSESISMSTEVWFDPALCCVDETPSVVGGRWLQLDSWFRFS